ncbi:MAG: hypothetical protein AAGU21_01055 [Solidesulfovibrio sp.]|uniref:hypothetical protein n=1 Tax=Solidesulfovibrio sp. TaxID=2910990 RepID=UPI002B2106B1|nr:hypothetical protein [Solidesulfovibrio sp.]MEA4857908.1 hypothetical protein [Solidesulfovibrio sp.]
MNRKLQDALNLIPDAATRNAIGEALSWLKEAYDSHTHEVTLGEARATSTTPMTGGNASRFPER